MGCSPNTNNNLETQQNKIQEHLEEDEVHFEQFAYEYSTNVNYRLDHTSSPLLIVTNGDALFAKKEGWSSEDLHFGIEFSNLLYDDSTIYDDRTFYNSTDENLVHVRYFSPLDSKIYCYNFERQKTNWLLKSILIDEISISTDESFFEFISKFGFDNSFRQSRIMQGATYTYLDEESMSEKTTVFTSENMREQDYLFKKIYLPMTLEHSDHVSLYIKGEGTGYNDRLYFHKINKKWFLTKEINLGM